MSYKAKVGDVIQIPGRRGLWVVEDAEMTGGGTAMFNDTYPDAWHVTARKLNAKGKYDPDGRTIRFTQDTNCYNDCIDGVTKQGKMKRVFV